MTRKHDKNTEDILKDIPNGKIIINRHNSTHENTIFNKDFRYCSDVRGLVDTYSVFPGIELSFNYYYANCFEFQHRPVHSAMQINHCRSGRMGWKMQDQSTIYLGPGDLSLHTLHSCADSSMNLPLGYYQGVSVFIDLDALTTTPPDILSEAGINGNNLYAPTYLLFQIFKHLVIIFYQKNFCFVCFTITFQIYKMIFLQTLFQQLLL